MRRTPMPTHKRKNSPEYLWLFYIRFIYSDLHNTQLKSTFVMNDIENFLKTFWIKWAWRDWTRTDAIIKSISYDTFVGVTGFCEMTNISNMILKMTPVRVWSFVLEFICELHPFVNQPHSETLNAVPRNPRNKAEVRCCAFILQLTCALKISSVKCQRGSRRTGPRRFTRSNYTVPSIQDKVSATQLETAASSRREPEEKRNRR